MIIGVPKEIKTHEYRVGLTVEAVREYTSRGHTVLLQSSAGSGVDMSDDDYRSVGAEIRDSAEAIFSEAEMIIKVKEPQPVEWKMLRPGQILFTYLHLAADREQALGLLESGCTAIAYETVTGPNGGLPLLAPMSEVAGRLSIEAAATALKSHNKGRGLLLGGVPGVSPVKVLVIGGGVVGTNAARMAVGLGAEVTVLDRSVGRLRDLDELFLGRVRTRYSTAQAIEDELRTAEVVIGAVLVPGASAPRLISKDMLSLMKERSVLVDVAIDQGGCFETSRPTTHDQPTYVVDGVVHYCVANMPGSVPLTSSQALSNVTLPFGLELADKGHDALIENAGLRGGLNVLKGGLTNEAVANSLGLPFERFEA